jgi:hypothetical protein
MEKEIADHKKQRAFFDMSGEDNIYKYITTEGKVFGEQAKKFTMLEYLQKSTGVFNSGGMLSKEEVKEMKARAQSGEKNIWHGFISFDEQHSELIDHPEKCIALVKQMFGEFFKDIGFDKDNIDLMCALHLDKLKHLHIHYIFWERAPKVKNKRAAGYTYRVKGKIPLSAIDKMTVRLNAWTIPDDIANKRDEATQALFGRKDFCKAWDRDYATKALLSLADKLPRDKPLYYASKDMEPYRADIDFAVQAIIDTDEKVRKADDAFKSELKRKQIALQEIMSKYYKQRLEVEKKTMDSEPPAYYEKYLANIHTIEKLEWDYKRRMGNIILKKVRYIQDNTYRYDKRRKHKTNDKYIKRNIAISDRIVKRSLNGLFNSIADLFSPEVNSHSNRLREIEEEIKQQSNQELQEEQQIVTSKTRWDWGK